MAKNLPKISIITPSFNQGQFIEQTILSVLSQNYPNLEYIVMDGGSKDNTLGILKKYQKHITWFSRKDKGQSDALNKGFKIATGEILAYINSDDYLEKDSLIKVADFFLKNPKAGWVTGKCKIVDIHGQEIRKIITQYKNIFLKYRRQYHVFQIIQFVSQPATFWRRDVFKDIGFFDESLYYDMDYDYWLRIWQKYPLFFIDMYLASYRIHHSSKGGDSPEKQFKVEHEVVSRYTNSKITLFLHRLHVFLALTFYRRFWLKQK